MGTVAEVRRGSRSVVTVVTISTCQIHVKISCFGKTCWCLSNTCVRVLTVQSPPAPFPNRTLSRIVEVAFHPPRAFSEDRSVFVYNFGKAKSVMKFLEEDKKEH